MQVMDEVITVADELVPLTRELHNRVIAQDNDLIASVAQMRQMPLKIFEIAVGALDTREDTDNPQRSVRIRKSIIFELLGQDDHNRDRRLRETMDSLVKEARFHLVDDDGRHEEIIAPIEAVEWRQSSPEVKLTFTPTIMPYLTQLKQNFTQYKLEYVARMNSKHAIVLYKLLAKEYNRYKYYKKKGVLTPWQERKFAHPEYSLDQLKRWTGTEGKYSRVTKFRERVLDVAMRDINRCTDWQVDYEPLRTGRYVTDFRFNIQEKAIAGALRPPKEEPGVTAPTDAQIVVDTMQSPYTQQLIRWQLLQPKDLTNPEIMLTLAREVYPQYDEIKRAFGDAQVAKHVEYVSHHYIAHPHGNVARYLSKAVKDYTRKLQKESNKEIALF